MNELIYSLRTLRKRLLYSLLLLPLFHSCRDVIVVEIEPTPDQIVVVSELTPDKNVELDLSVTADIFSGERAVRPEDATIFLSGSDLPAGATAFIFSSKSDKYQFRNKDFRPAPDETYSLSINIPGTDFVDLFASTTIPRPVTVDRAMVRDVHKIEAANGMEDIVFDIDFEIGQSQNNDTYLHIVPKRVLSQYKIDANGEQRITFFAETEVLHVVQIQDKLNAINELNHREGVFVDYSKLGVSQIKLRLSTATLLDPSIDILQNIEVTVYTLSKELYKYHQNLHKQLINNSSSFTSPTSTYSNIENGLGVFGGMSSSSSLIKL